MNKKLKKNIFALISFTEVIPKIIFHLFPFRMHCSTITYIIIRVRTYENSFKEPCPIEEEGLSRADLHPEKKVILCMKCAEGIYPLDWLTKKDEHVSVGKEIPLYLQDLMCVRCLGSVMKIEDSKYCEKCEQKNVNSNS